MTAPTPLRPAGPDGRADREAWTERGRTLLAAEQSRHWDLADWVAEGRSAFGDSSVRKTVEVLGLPRTNFRRYLAISASSVAGRYRSTLGFSLLAEVAHLPEAEADRILSAAEAGGWTVKQVREAAREASLEGRLRRQRDEIARLQAENRRLKLDHATALAEANRTEARVKGACQAIETAYREIADVLDALSLGAGLSLHGNARPGVRRRVQDLLLRATARVNRLTDDRIAPALERISGGRDAT